MNFEWNDVSQKRKWIMKVRGGIDSVLVSMPVASLPYPPLQGSSATGRLQQLGRLHMNCLITLPSFARVSATGRLQQLGRLHMNWASSRELGTSDHWGVF